MTFIYDSQVRMDYLHDLVGAAAEAIDAPCSCSRKALNKGEHDDGCWQPRLREALDIFCDHDTELVPGEVVPLLVASAPRRIFLPISDDFRDMKTMFPSHKIDEVSWCESTSALSEVEYVRFDLVQALMAYARRTSELGKTPGWLCPNCKCAHAPDVTTCPVDNRTLREKIRST